MPPPPNPRRDQQVLRHARRESKLLLTLWALCLVWSVGYGTLFGYNLEPGAIHLILGMPAWVFWSVVLPWGLCLVFTFWFCFFFMADDDLGQDQEEGPGHA